MVWKPNREFEENWQVSKIYAEGQYSNVRQTGSGSRWSLDCVRRAAEIDEMRFVSGKRRKCCNGNGKRFPGRYHEIVLRSVDDMSREWWERRGDDETVRAFVKPGYVAGRFVPNPKTEEMSFIQGGQSIVKGTPTLWNNWVWSCEGYENSFILISSGINGRKQLSHFKVHLVLKSMLEGPYWRGADIYSDMVGIRPFDETHHSPS